MTILFWQGIIFPTVIMILESIKTGQTTVSGKKPTQFYSYNNGSIFAYRLLRQ